MRRTVCLLFLAAWSFSIQAGPDLPGELKGRWIWVKRGLSQSFALEEIRRTDGDSFSAKLSWWTIDARCAIRSEPIVGKLTDGGLSFNATTKCDIPISVELRRGENGWNGTGSAQSVQPIELELQAK